MVNVRLSIIQLRINVGYRAFRRHVRNGPERHQIGDRADPVRDRRMRRSFRRPKMPDCDPARLPAPREHAKRRVIAAVIGHAMIVAAELTRDCERKAKVLTGQTVADRSRG
jgi:hypothetical protein